MKAARLRGSPLCIIALLASIVVPAVGCTSENIVFGNIPPSTFQFTTVIEQDGHDPGGWQVAQVLVLLGRLSAMFPRAAVCEVEVGAPLLNTQQGVITKEMAQNASAVAADKAARDLLGKRLQTTASICISFRETMQYFLADPNAGVIDGAKVNGFLSWPGKKVPRRTFPPRRGR